MRERKNRLITICTLVDAVARPRLASKATSRRTEVGQVPQGVRQQMNLPNGHQLENPVVLSPASAGLFGPGQRKPLRQSGQRENTKQWVYSPSRKREELPTEKGGASNE
jgi:hypothetical protein